MVNTIAPLQASSQTSWRVYLVLSQTGTLLSRVLKVVTGAEYNHVSISLCPDLERMYSFGRRRTYNPFWGGFVEESPHKGVFKRFPKTKAVVLALPVSQKAYQDIALLLRRMLTEQTTYHYNYLGLLLAAAHIKYRRGRHYYCSEFVRELLLRCQIRGSEQLAPIVQPIHFLAFPGGETIYCGYLCNYFQARGGAAPVLSGPAGK